MGMIELPCESFSLSISQSINQFSGSHIRQVRGHRRALPLLVDCTWYTQSCSKDYHFLRRTASKWSAPPRCLSSSEKPSNMRSTHASSTLGSASASLASSPPPRMPSVDRRLTSSAWPAKCCSRNCRACVLLVWNDCDVVPWAELVRAYRPLAS